MANKKNAKNKGDDQSDEVDPGAPGLPGYLGVGLIASLAVGWSPLRDALFGYGPLDDALVRFVTCVVACGAGASFIGRMLDRAPLPRTEETSADPGTATSSNTASTGGSS